MKRIKSFIGLLLTAVLLLGISNSFATKLTVHAAETANGTCGDNLTWTLTDDGTLTISGTGDMINYTFSSLAPWYGYRSGIKTVIICDGVTGIGDLALVDCAELTDITIPDSVTSIGSNAFDGCSGLTGITIPDSVTDIGVNAFSECTCDFTVSAGNPNYTDIDGVLFNKAMTELITCPDGKTGVYTVPDSVTSIGSNAFEGCFGLTGITIPDSVTSIGSGAFALCELTSITIPDSVTCIGEYAFFNSSLTEIIIPNSVTSIGDNAFYGCYLTDITIPASVTVIGKSVLAQCWELASVTILGNITSIGNYAFYECGSLTEITIPASVTDIGNDAFAWCTDLAKVTFKGTTPPSVSDSAFDGVAAAVYYPDNRFWTEDVRQDYGGTLTWVAYEAAYSDICGDADGDNEITDWDGILLSRYLAGWTVSLENISAMDTDGDGEITDWDGVLLDRYLAGWNVNSQIGK